MKRLALFLIAVVILALPLTLVLAQGPEETLIVRTIGDVNNWNPVMFQDSGSFQSTEMLWPRVFETDPMTGLPQPGLASWTVSDDTLTYTFTLRDGLKWSDGQPITANDAKFLLDAVASDKVETPRKGNVALIDSVTVIDDKTFAIKLKSVNCTFFEDLRFFRLLPSYRFAPDFSDFMTNSISTNPDISGGPYLLEEWKTGEYARFKANPDYWKGEPKIKYVINKIIVDPPIVNQALMTGEIDYATMAADQFEQLTDTSKLNVHIFPEDSIAFFDINWTDPDNPMPAYDENGNLNEQPPHPIFSDVRVRQAFAMGYNRDEIIATLGENGGVPLVGSVNPAITWAYNNDIQPYTYDPEKAAALLDEAGWVMNESTGIREKDGMPLKFTISYSPILEYFKNMALVAQDQLGQLGMDVSTDSVEWIAFLNDVWSAQKFDVAILAFIGIGADPSNLAYTIEHSTNDGPGAYNAASSVDPELDKLLEDGRSVPGCSAEDRAPIYKEIQRIEHEKVIRDYVFSPNIYHVINKRVGDFAPGAWWGILGYGDHIHEFTLSS